MLNSTWARCVNFSRPILPHSHLFIAACGIHLPGAYGATGQQDPCDLGQGHPSPRKLWRGSLQVPQEHPPSCIRCQRPCDALPQQQYVSIVLPSSTLTSVQSKCPFHNGTAIYHIQLTLRLLMSCAIIFHALLCERWM